MEDFHKIITDQAQIKINSGVKFYSSDGNEINEETLSLVKANDIIYLEPHGNPFDYNNILGQYKIIKQLGEGGFGSVHKAEHNDDKTIVAIKYIDITECSKLN